MKKRISVVIDIRDLRVAKTGAKTYLEETCRQLLKEVPGFAFHFADTWVSVYTGHNKLLKIIEHIRFFSWKQIILPSICVFRKADILFCTDYFLPLLKPNYKTAVVFYDAFFWQYPDQYNTIWLRLLNTIGLTAAQKADAVITISHHSKEKIIQYAGIAGEKIHPIHLAPKSVKKSVDITKAVIDPQKKYILHIGVLEKRKNLPNLIRAFEKLVKDGYDNYNLILVGNIITKEKIDDSENIKQLISTFHLEDRVIIPGFVSDEELANYYANATVYAFVSINEGFGLPVLEAFQNNLPTLIADNSCLPEIGGDAVIACNPFDVDDIYRKLKMIIDDPSLQNELKEKGKKRLAEFSWERATQELLDVFKEIAAR